MLHIDNKQLNSVVKTKSPTATYPVYRLRIIDFNKNCFNTVVNQKQIFLFNTMNCMEVFLIVVIRMHYKLLKSITR